MFKIAFVGNPNAGKSTWINYLANTDMKVANYNGVSVEAQMRTIQHSNEDWNFIDLPGIYDLQIVSGEESYTKHFLETQRVDFIVNVIDARDLKRGLHLCAQLKKLKIPMVVLLNFMEEKVNINQIKQLSEIIKTPILYEGFQQREKILDTFYDTFTNYAYTCFNDKDIRRVNALGSKKKYQPDRFLLHPLWGIPLLVLILVFSIVSIYLLSKPMSDFFTNCFDSCFAYVLSFISLEGVFKNIIESLFFSFTSIVSFLPFLAGIFFLIALLEESGYIARIAFLLDPVMQYFHLSGRSVIPLLIGFGCNVPAIMATRTIENKVERYACALMIPFISCSAKLPIFLLFTSVFFADTQVVIIILLYALSIVMSLFVGCVFASHKNDDLFLMELPSYAIPKGNVLYQKVKIEILHFLKKVCKVMIVSALLLAFIFPFISVNKMQKALTPLGFSKSYDAVESLPFGLISKENLVVYYVQKKKTQDMRDYLAQLWQDDTQLLALCYLLYLAMSIPCVMTLAAIKSEFGTKFLMLSILVMVCIPFIVTLIAYQGIQLLRFLF